MPLNEIELLVLPTIENIEEILRGIPLRLTKAYYSSLEFKFKENDVSILHYGRDIKTFNLVWLSSYWASRDLATTVKLYLDNHNIPNTHVEHSSSKISDQMNFVLNSIPTPPSYYIENANILEHIDDIENTCGYPMIMKDTKGYGGNYAEFITNREELVKSIKNQKQFKKYIFQKYIINDYDWGVLVANGKVVSAERSYPKAGEFRNNVGATEVFCNVCDVPENVKEIAIKASTILGLSWSRSDIIIEKYTNSPYLLEVNRFPGITKNSTEISGALEFISTSIRDISTF